MTAADSGDNDDCKFGRSCLGEEGDEGQRESRRADNRGVVGLHAYRRGNGSQGGRTAEVWWACMHIGEPAGVEQGGQPRCGGPACIS